VASEIVELINSVGFPIAAFLLTFWQNTRVLNKNTEALQGLKEVIERKLR